MSEEPSTPKIIPCKYCGQSIPETTNFCWYCGRELIARPERPDSNPSSRVNNKALVIIFFIAVAAVAVLAWSMYTH